MRKSSRYVDLIGCLLVLAALVIATAGSAVAAPDDGSVLPFPPTPSASTAGPTLQESTHKRRIEKSRLPEDAPNILIILLDDRAHAMVADHPLVITSALRYPELAAIVTPFTYEPIGVAVACNDPLLVNWLENLMKHLEAMGEMKKMKARWFESGSWINDLP